ncbi:MAG: hypothetical protein SF339_04865 [Blastocatellia bacterium]|nr:hypothetical protein [Blastocatellia bacterium]
MIFRWAIAGLVALAALGGVTGWTVKRRAERALIAAREARERAQWVPFERELRRPMTESGIALMQNSGAVRDLAAFRGAYFAATEAGLAEFGEDGAVRRRWTVLDGLPESDLTAAAVFGAKLYIGTRSRGLVAFDGSRFERYRWTDREAQAVTTLTEARGRLLVGTFAGGLLEFDGAGFREIRSGGAEGERIAGITCVVDDGGRLVIGTFAGGLWIKEGDAWSHVAVVDGLPSNRVVGIAAAGARLIIATDFGAAAVAANAPADAAGRRVEVLATLPALGGIAAWGDAILLCKENGELFRLNTADGRGRLDPVSWGRAGNVASCRLKAFGSGSGETGQASTPNRSEHALWLLSSEGLWRTGWQDARFPGRFAPRPFGRAEEAAGLTNNLISAMAFDDLGRLWVGSFRRGIDLFTPEGRRIAHLESEAVREINSLVWDDGAKRMLAGTAQGLAQFDGTLQMRAMTKSDGLLANSVAHAVPLGAKGGALALATSRGLSFIDGERRQALTTAQGLPSNSAYAILRRREFLFAGTLGGLAQIAGGRVVRVFTDANSKLSQNWVTALCAAGDRLFVGAYGGVFELTPAGEFTSFASQIGKQIVNPNAMYADEERLYVGTLDGVWVLDLRSQRWRALKDELPARTVLSVTGDGRHVYFGTTSGIARVRAESGFLATNERE